MTNGTGPALSAAERARAIDTIRRLNEAPDLGTVEPYLPLFFSLNGKPYGLDDHFPFKAMFRTRIPRKRVRKTARQCSKSTGMAAESVVLAAKIPHFKQLFLTPLFEQIRRFSVNYIQPFVDESLIKPLIVDTGCNQSVLQRTFLNRSMMLFSYAYLSSSRIRGIGGVHWTKIDEFQDMDLVHLPIIVETMSAATKPWGVLDMAGTPKGFDNSMQKAWDASSQAEWVIRCRVGGCNHWNFCTTEFGLMKMIGPPHDGIGPASKGGVPGLLCAKCRKPIDPRTGSWLHRHKDRRWDYQGFHVPQVILPMHYEDPVAWAVLYGKMHGAGNTSPAQFQNEVLGESCDTGSKLLSLTELRAACSLDRENDQRRIPELSEAELANYAATVLGVDWGGGGGDGIVGGTESGRRRRISFTTVAWMGIRHDGRIDVLWGCRLLTPNDHAREAGQVRLMIERLRPHFVAHDFNGAGALRETLLVQAGVHPGLLQGFVYGTVATHKRLDYVSGELGDVRPHYRLDKTTSILLTIEAIKRGLVRFFKYDNRGEKDPGLVEDFLALTEEKVETGGTDRYIIRRLTAFPDDFAHAVNLGAIALWHATQRWPDLATGGKASPAADQGGEFEP